MRKQLGWTPLSVDIVAPSLLSSGSASGEQLPDAAILQWNSLLSPARLILGEMAEWTKAHAWKACGPQKGLEGSNPSLSARAEDVVRTQRKVVPGLDHVRGHRVPEERGAVQIQ